MTNPYFRIAANIRKATQEDGYYRCSCQMEDHAESTGPNTKSSGSEPPSPFPAKNDRKPTET